MTNIPVFPPYLTSQLELHFENEERSKGSPAGGRKSMLKYDTEKYHAMI